MVAQHRVRWLAVEFVGQILRRLDTLGTEIQAVLVEFTADQLEILNDVFNDKNMPGMVHGEWVQATSRQPGRTVGEYLRPIACPARRALARLTGHGRVCFR